MGLERYASPNEQRTISREHCGFYNAVVIGGIYEFCGIAFDVRSNRSFYGAVKRCVDRYALLNVMVRDMDTDKAFFERVATINLDDHISIAEEIDSTAFKSGNIVENHRGHGGHGNGEETTVQDLMNIELLLPSILDRSLPASSPPWRVVVHPISHSSQAQKETTCCFIAFAFSHALADGISALAFHRTFRDGIFDLFSGDYSNVATTAGEFPPAFDTPENLPISWRFLLAPLVAVLLPKLISSMLGLRATASAVNPKSWTATKMFLDPKSFHSCLKLVEIEGPQLNQVLRVARKNGARLTAVLNHCIVRALSRTIPPEEAGNFISGTAVNMRPAVGTSNDEMGLFVNAWFDFHEREEDFSISWSDKTWADIRCLTKKLAGCAVALRDQPVGLLRYVPSISKWTMAKLGKERDCSFELSNLGAFEAATCKDPASGGECNIIKMIFSRPADAISSPLSFSVASVKEGSMVIAIGWQPGALGVPFESEAVFVDRLCNLLKEDLLSFS